MKGVLEGVRILDLTQMLAGPFGSMMMADLGAEIIKVEPPVGDSTRGNPPLFYGKDSAYYWSVNRNKKSIVIDLKHPEGLRIFYELVGHADVVFDNFNPGVMERLKIDFQHLKEINPKIICCSISTFGQTSPYRDRPGYDLIVQAMSGGMSITGEPGREPVRAGIPIGDLTGGFLAVQGIMGSLISRGKTGCGLKIDISLLDGQLYLLTYIAQYYFHSGKIPGPIGAGHQSNVIYQSLKTKDIRIVVVAHRDHHFRRFCQAIGQAEWANDPRFATGADRLSNKSKLIEMVEEVLQTQNADVWLEKVHQAGVAAGPILTIDRALNNAHVLARNMVIEIDGRAGEKVKMIGNPIKMDETIFEDFTAPPQLGEHTHEVLEKILGYSSEKIQLLAKDGIIKTS